MKSTHLTLLDIIFLLSACNPHPTSGVWKATADNDYGINKLVVSFDGRATFTTSKLDNAVWQCFWSATSKQQTELDCTPSTDTEKEERFILNINETGLTELHHNDIVITSFTLQDENPSPVE